MILRDLFCAIGNRHWDLGRISSGLAILSVLAGQGWNMALGQPIDLGPSGLSGGLAALLTACAAFIYAKDRARNEAARSTTGEPNA